VTRTRISSTLVEIRSIIAGRSIRPATSNEGRPTQLRYAKALQQAALWGGVTGQQVEGVESHGASKPIGIHDRH
jgi:hypothetical protein